MRWYRITFNDTLWVFDHSDQNSKSLCPESTIELWCSGVREMMSGEPGLHEVLNNLSLRGYIKSITYYVNSDIFGPRTPRSELLFPSEIYFPSNHELTPGRKKEVLVPRVVSLKNCKYVFSGILNIGLASVDADDIPRMKEAKGAAFVGCLDDNPLSLLMKKTVNPPTTTKDKLR
ncbi:TPA_asm: M [Primula alphacytorhabdovirus 1]|nr:TPA_asm: M [Primula alphacytorhabdovirus 1]